ncbi:hypothetical protein BKA63DRAFT_526408 [Paraphoma chrysanthemicola]|nr:hypothetical protein BKA63DRAFT_526408 [Paraphoma chrysanthemicola]
MPVPLPITLHGPVTVISQTVRVTGVHQGAKVEIYDGDDRVGADMAQADGQAYIRIETSRLVESHALTGLQITSEGASERSRYGVQVKGVSLEPPRLTSVLHTRMSDIQCENLTPGATLVTLIDGNEVGNQTITREKSLCGIDDFELQITAGSKVEIYQKATINGNETSGPSPDLPFIPPFPTDYKDLLPGNLQPAKECDTRLIFFNMVPGAITEVDNEGQTFKFFNVQRDFWLNMSFPVKKGNIQLRQRLPRCIKEPGPAWNETIEPYSSIPPPVLNHEVCDQVLRITASGLIPPGNLYITHVQMGDGLPSEGKKTPLERYPFVENVATVDLPSDISTRHPGGATWFLIKQEHCGKESPEAYRGMQGGGNPTDGGPPRFATDLYECGTVIPLENVFPGTNLQAFDASGEAISDIIQSPGLTPVLQVYPSLKEGPVTVTQSGCGEDAKITTSVIPLPSPLPTPGLARPVRPTNQLVFLTGVLTDASVYIVVKHRDNPVEEIQSAITRIINPAQAVIKLFKPLQYKDLVVAVQMICKSTSKPKSSEYTSVAPGKLKLDGIPSQATRGSPCQFTVRAFDMDNGQAVPGTVSINGTSYGPVGQLITYTPPPGVPNAIVTVNAGEAYEQGSRSITLVDPVTEWTLNLKATPIPTSLSIDAINSVPVNVANIVWTITPDWDPSHPQVLRPYVNNPWPAFAKEILSSVRIPIPTGSNKRITAQMSADALALWPGGAEIVPVISAPVHYFYAGNSAVSLSWFLYGAFIEYDPVTLEGRYAVKADGGS